MCCFRSAVDQQTECLVTLYVWDYVLVLEQAIQMASGLI
jgi:hypothetical protein